MWEKNILQINSENLLSYFFFNLEDTELKKQMRIRTTVKTSEGWWVFFIVADFFQISEIFFLRNKSKNSEKKKNTSVFLVED